MFATAEDLGFERPLVRARLRQALHDFGNKCFDLCTHRGSCFDLCADPHYAWLHKHPRLVNDPELSCSLINTSYVRPHGKAGFLALKQCLSCSETPPFLAVLQAMLDYGVLCDGKLNEPVNGEPENRSRIYYSYDRFEDIRGPLLLATNKTIAYEDPTAQQVRPAVGRQAFLL